jgi:hypothetical protein
MVLVELCAIVLMDIGKIKFAFLLVVEIHTLFMREFETMRTLPIMMLLCWLVMLLVKLLMIRSVA